ncbi:MAG: hypothetical protein ACFUZC_08555 [Chthoniobacteraceae bacterium]
MSSPGLLRPAIRRNAIALVITLITLAIITIVIVGLLATMRVERVSSHSHLERNRATYFAQMGIERTIGLLKREIADTNISWVSFPGLILSSGSMSGSIVTTGTTFGPLTRAVELYSGTASSSQSGSLRPPNLNTQILQDQNPCTYLITDQPRNPLDSSSGVVELPLRWIYIRQDGSEDPSDPPVLTSTTNPIVGRYAYWADDESSKVNYNLAWKRSASGGSTPSITQGHPSNINLPSLSGSMPEALADKIHAAVTTDNYTTIKRLFNSPYDARQLSADIARAINANKFDVTHYNHDPNTTFFNKPRIVLTTQKKYAPRDANGNLLIDPDYGAPYFLDILKTDNTDPGGSTSETNSVIDETKLSATVNLLIKYMQRTDWPMVSGSDSFQKKYYNNDSSGLAQFALEIIDYVRCKESAFPLVPPLQGYFDGTFVTTESGASIPHILTDFSTSATNNGRVPSCFVGFTRMPLITEVGVWFDTITAVSEATKNQTFDTKIKVEFYLPKNYGLDEVDLGASGFGFSATYQNPSTGGNAPQGAQSTVTASECSTGTTKLKVGEYLTVTRKIVYNGKQPSWGIFSSRPTQLAVIVKWSGTQGSLQVVPQLRNWQGGYGLVCPLDPEGVADTGIHSLEVDDPRCNLYGGGASNSGDWQPGTSGSNTFGAVNSICSVGTTSVTSVSPQQDTDSSGAISDASLYMPFPKGSAQNPTGLVSSPGELGYIHTGINRAKKSVSWRTIRLQPNNYSDTKTVPDWAFMDLFAAPVDFSSTAANVFFPHTTTIAGRINMNAQTQPFGNPNGITVPVQRIYPLKALFEGVLKSNTSSNILSSSEAEEIARNIYNHTLATGTNPGKDYGDATKYTTEKINAYDSQGEVVEIKGVADGGEATEEVVRGIANLITARGSVFSIYTIGQAIKQKPDESLIVTGEQRLQANIERYQNPSTQKIRFRTIYFRNLTP